MDLSGLFGNTYAERRVLVTGHTGFKGSWLVLWLRSMGAEVAGLSLDPDTSPSHWTLLQLDGLPDHRIDLADAEAVREILEVHRPEIVFHLAAQSLVRRSYREPIGTFRSNVMGLVNLLEAVRASTSVRALVNATTDKVYQNQTTDFGYRETDALGGHDPYSTSKACAELITDCYRQSFYGVSGNCTRVATARAGNVIGGGDWAEDRLVPDLVRAAIASKPLRLRNPNAIRPWQHVLEPLSGYLRLGQALLAGEAVEGAWNFGPASDATMSVGELVEIMRQFWPGLGYELSPGPHLHEAETLRLDCRKAVRELGWRPVWDAQATISRTIAWYRSFQESGALPSENDLRDYVAQARAVRIGWAA